MTVRNFFMTHQTTDHLAVTETPQCCRAHSVTLRPPGLTDSTYRLDRQLGQHLERAIAAATDPSSADLIEVLCASAPGHIAIHLTERPNASRAEESGTQTRASDGSRATRLCSALTDTLPDWVGVEQGRLVLDPIGYAALPTARAVVDDGSGTPQVDNLVRTLFTQAYLDEVALLCQLLVRRTGRETYAVTLRVAECLSVPRPLGRRALTDAIATPRHDVLATVTPDRIASSRCLAQRHWEARAPRLGPSESTPPVLHALATDDDRRASTAARRTLELLPGTHEFTALRAGRPAGEPYTDLDVAPELTVSREELASLLDVFPSYYGIDWPVARSRPRLYTASVVSTVVGSEVDRRRIDADPTRGRACPASLPAFLAQWLAETGCQPDRAADRQRGHPHLRGTPDGDDAPAVLVDPTADRTAAPIATAGELLVIANRAVRAGDRLLVVTPTAETAQWARETLVTPYERARSDRMTVPYTIPVMVPDGGGGRVVVPRNGRQPTWVVSTDGTQRLLVGDRVVAAGPITAPLDTLSYETSQLVEASDRQGDGHVVTRPDGTVERFPSRETWAAEYVAAGRPIYPVRPTFRGAVTVAYRDGTTLRRVATDRAWNRPRRPVGITPDLTAALSVFLDRYTGPVTTDVDTPQFGPILDTWLNAQVDEQFTSVLSAERQAPDDIPLQRNESGRIVGVDGHGWRIPATDLPLARANGDYKLD